MSGDRQKQLLVVHASFVACSNRIAGWGSRQVVTSCMSHRALAFPGLVKALAADQAGVR
jgi:hypothetical protein